MKDADETSFALINLGIQWHRQFPISLSNSFHNRDYELELSLNHAAFNQHRLSAQ